jgi:hypothetical protein
MNLKRLYILLKNLSSKTFEKGEIVIKEGNTKNNVFYISSSDEKLKLQTKRSLFQKSIDSFTVEAIEILMEDFDVQEHIKLILAPAEGLLDLTHAHQQTLAA